MKKLTFIALAAAALLCLSSCDSPSTPVYRVPVEGITGLEAYTDFVNNLHSAELKKFRYSFHTLYEFCASEATDIKFNENAAGERELLYRRRNPFVLWDFPPYDYYNGHTYYYKYKDSWFTDNFSKYENVQKNDFVAIKETVFTGNDVLFDVIYHDGEGYSAEATVQTPDKTAYYSLSAKLTRDFGFKSIRINEFHFNFDTNEFEKKNTHLFYYTHINEGIAITPPKGLNPGAAELAPPPEDVEN